MSDKQSKGNGKAPEAPADAAIVAAGNAPLATDPTNGAPAIDLPELTAAAQAAAAVPELGVPTAEQREKNRILRGVQRVMFKANQSKPYPADKQGNVSMKLASFVLIWNPGSHGSQGNIYARIAPTKGAKPTVECSFAGNRGQSGITATDDHGVGELEAVRNWIEAEYVKFRKAGNIQTTATRAVYLDEQLFGTDSDDTNE